MSVRKPFLFELDDQPGIDPGAAAAPPDALPEGRAMMRALQVSRRRMSLFSRLGLSALSAFVMLAISVTAWDFVAGLVVRNAALGYLALGLLVVIAVATLAFSLREWAGFRRLRQIDSLRIQAELARSTSDRAASAQLMAALSDLYTPRPEMHWPRDHLAELAPDQLDAQGLLDLTETVLLAPLDDAARREVEAAARQVALLTAMLPLALVDVLAALITNLRMIRRVAELYGGRAGTLGSLRLMRGVITHLLATGAVAVGEDMIGSVASGGLVSKLSRRFGEGIVNGALTARLGIAAIEVCRPLPFHALPRPRTSNIMSRALTGLFDRA